MIVRYQAGQQQNGQRHSLSVAVVGGGAAGLAAARELLRAGHRATVFEKSNNVGGVWDYREEVEDHPLGLGDRHVHGSMYANLRTNLPREVMGFSDYPFDTAFAGSADPRQFCSHQEVQRYLEAFADEFHLRQHVRLGTEVQRLTPISASSSSSSDAGGSTEAPPDWLRWEVTSRPVQRQHGQQHGASASSSSSSSVGSTTERFDAAIIASGHYSRPRLPQIPGQDVFPGRVMHSHNYRRPECYAGQTVVLLGASSSGVDIAEEIANAGAKRVYLCARVWENPLTGEVLDITSRVIQGSAASSSSAAGHAASRRATGSDGGEAPGAVQALPAGITKAATLQELRADGSVTLADGSRIEDVDVVMYCTGYLYDFPFLAGTDIVTVDDNRVAPLFQHVFPPATAPTLSFLGLPWKIVPFPQFELQARWVAHVLAGVAALPSRQDMEAHAASFYASLAEAGVPVRYTHRMSGSVQWEYNRWLAVQCGEPTWQGASWREAMYNACGMSRKLNAERYRDCQLPSAAEAEAEAREEAARVRRQRS